MKVCLCSAECVPYVKTGGLADITGSLPKSLEHLGCEVIVLVPLYNTISTIFHGLLQNEEFLDVQVKVGDQIHSYNLWEGKLPDSEVSVYFIDCPHYFHRGKPYTDDKDEDERFIFFQLAILETLQRLKWSPDILHCNDWQTSLLPVYLKTTYAWDELFKKTSSLLTIHNIGYQGRFSKDSIFLAGLSYDEYYPEGPFEMNSAFSFLKAGILYADVITTVSPTYAKEIQTTEYGSGMEGVLTTRKDDLFGILNGIDTTIWNPEIDDKIPYNYSEKKIKNKYKIRAELFKEAEFYDVNIPIIGIVSRLAGQKGIELIEPIITEILNIPVNMIVLGSGEKKYERFIELAAASFKGKFIEYVGFNDELAHLITAGSDMFLMPSLYEPCGLNQMYSLVYGTVPIVRKTGGLADTVKDFHEFSENGNGFSFDEASPRALYLTIKRAVDIYYDRIKWSKIMKNGMREDFSWEHSAKEYVDIYKKYVKRKEF
ncbi:glycogen synthase [soil metagenome]